eukprot:6228083-Prymnesium_polylepis.1
MPSASRPEAAGLAASTENMMSERSSSSASSAHSTGTDGSSATAAASLVAKADELRVHRPLSASTSSSPARPTL